MDRFIGKILDNRYELLEVIGTGGMAVVYKAKCHRLNRFVAIKILKDEFAQDEEFRRRFHDESQSVAMLSHPNIVAVYDVSRTGNVEYIVMELIEGITLKEFMYRRGPLPWNEATFFAMQIAKALEHAHSRGIIHRDIKPQNIMLLRDGTLKVADFGIARQVAQQKTNNISEAIGSVHYIAPEQAKGSHIDNRADIYSLGVVMYEMLTSRLPFEGESAVSVAIQHIRSIPLPPSDYIEGLPKALEDITMKAMNPNLSQRYSTATELLQDLENFKNDPDFKVDVKIDEPITQLDSQLDATIKLQNPGQVHRRERENDELKNSKKGRNIPKSMIFSAAAIFVFVIGALYFMIAVINPFGKGGSTTIPVPDLKGSIFAEVEIDPDMLENFTIEKGEEVYNETAAAGLIISQDPVADTKVEKGQVITVVVSRGPKTVTMKNYVNTEYRQAEIDLDRLGIEFIEQMEFSPDVIKDNIIRTEPAAGEEIADGEKVVLVISKGKELKDVVVPDVMGSTEAEAKAQLEKAGLMFGTPTQVDSDKPDGTVIFQSVPSGSTVKEQTVVDIQISRNKAPEKKTKIISFSIVEAEGDVTVEVKVNGETQYSATHLTTDGEIMVPLVANAGANTVRIIQNGVTTLEQSIEF